MSKNIIKGRKAEDLAKAYLESIGYRILHRNWRHGQKEVDIIATINDVLVFCEVKCRTNDKHANPSDSVDVVKQKNIIEAAEANTNLFGWNKSCRFDIVSVLLDDVASKITHIEDAFQPWFD